MASTPKAFQGGVFTSWHDVAESIRKALRDDTSRIFFDLMLTEDAAKQLTDAVTNAGWTGWLSTGGRKPFEEFRTTEGTVLVGSLSTLRAAVNSAAAGHTAKRAATTIGFAGKKAAGFGAALAGAAATKGAKIASAAATTAMHACAKTLTTLPGALAEAAMNAANVISDATLRMLAGTGRGVCVARVTQSGTQIGTMPFVVVDDDLCYLYDARCGITGLVASDNTALYVADFWQAPYGTHTWVGPRDPKSMAPLQFDRANPATCEFALRVRHRLGNAEHTAFIATQKKAFRIGQISCPPFVHVEVTGQRRTISVMNDDWTACAKCEVQNGDINVVTDTHCDVFFDATGGSRGHEPNGKLDNAPGHILDGQKYTDTNTGTSIPFALQATLLHAWADDSQDHIWTVEYSDAAQAVYLSRYEPYVRLIPRDECDTLPYPVAKGWPQRVAGLRGIHAMQSTDKTRNVLLLYVDPNALAPAEDKPWTLAEVIHRLHSKWPVYVFTDDQFLWYIDGDRPPQHETPVLVGHARQHNYKLYDGRCIAFQLPPAQLSVVITTSVKRFLCSVNSLRQDDAFIADKNKRLELMIKNATPGEERAALIGMRGAGHTPKFEFIMRDVANWLPI